MFPGLREKNPQSEGGQVDQSETWAINQLFTDVTCLWTIGCGPYRRSSRKISMCPGGILPYSVPQPTYQVRQVTTSSAIPQDCLIPSHRATIFRQTGGQDAHRDTHQRHAVKW
ncbi:hypothetical protein TNCV_3758471 [Trichonephila clavipes]|nr:hypothetical protein TNCV_3758471 [Trichonephila clavipes]